jgi:3-deoxy-D-manno-octulosonic acid kinase
MHDWAAAQPGARAFEGRGAAYAVHGAGAGWVVRHYRRGGSVAWILGDRYVRIGALRPLRELHASVLARDRGVATPEIVAAVVYPSGAFYRADLVTRLIPDSADLADTALGTARAGPAARIASWHAAGALLRGAFAAGIRHADLNLRNILIRRRDGAVAETAAAAHPDGSRAVLLDLDRAEVRDGAVPAGARAAMLRRLHRSRRKLERALGTTTSVAELTAFEQGLAGAASVARDEGI